MAAQKGKDLLLKIDDGSGAFVTVAGLRTQRFALNADPVDVTNQESAGRWRELLAGAGVRRASVAGSGVFKLQKSADGKRASTATVPRQVRHSYAVLRTYVRTVYS